MTLSERMNFSSFANISNSIEIDNRKNINYYETLCLYCADNNIKLTSVSDSEFDSAITTFKNHNSNAKKRYFFSIDKG